MQNQNRLKLAILWHMHQPNYREPHSDRLVMPWVRLHAIKDYLDMPLLAAEQAGVKATFNLVPSLLDQIELYIEGGTDPHMELSLIPADQLDDQQKTKILESFFEANVATMINPYERFNQLFHKVKAGQGESIVPALFSSEEIRDLQVWSNLCWVDPSFHSETPIKGLLEKGRHFSEEDKVSLIQWQRNLMGRIIPTYRDLLEQERIDISFTPYYHPILPLLCDTDIALEAMPGADLPSKRFRHPEDARFQVESSVNKYEELFGRKLRGMWPSEGSVSEEAVGIIADAGIEWIATDEEVLYYSLKKSGVSPEDQMLPALYNFQDKVKVFFRDHSLSDRIGFVYSGWDADKAVEDFLQHAYRIREALSSRLDEVVVPIILDGENAWEYFANDGRDFLSELYRRLVTDDSIEMISLSEAAGSLPARPLPRLFAGSWINHNFRIWIGHSEDNAAWDMLGEAREELVKFETENPAYDADKLKSAWNQIYIAEGSDWCWWYGDEHRGMNNEQFDTAFRRHLIAVYEFLGLEIPFELLNPIYQSGLVYESLTPDALITPQLDGRVTHYYEWAGAGLFDCSKAGDAMHRVERYISRLYYAYDQERLYIRLDFLDRKQIDLIEKPKVMISFFKPVEHQLDLVLVKGSPKSDNGVRYAYQDVLELSIERALILPEGSGQLEFGVVLYDGESKLESAPLNSTIRFEIPQKDKEMFWPV
ncbi:MAG: glycoside hydrolase family 57 protein [bacterium]|nr:glycoside hydrolase family 57 protein [bacterium]